MPEVWVLAQILKDIKLDTFSYHSLNRKFKMIQIIYEKEKAIHLIWTQIKMGNQNNEPIQWSTNNAGFGLQAVLIPGSLTRNQEGVPTSEWLENLARKRISKTDGSSY